MLRRIIDVEKEPDAAKGAVQGDKCPLEGYL